LKKVSIKSIISSKGAFWHLFVIYKGLSQIGQNGLSGTAEVQKFGTVKQSYFNIIVFPIVRAGGSDREKGV